MLKTLQESTMLKTLQRIIQEVSATTNLTEALRIMVQRVKEAVNTQSATIYLIDNRHGEFVLMATDGLNEDAVGKARIPLDQGLIGLILRREEPLNLEDASSHPAYYYDPKISEEKFCAFLGIPIIHQRRTYGVLAIQQEERRRFDEEESISGYTCGPISQCDCPQRSQWRSGKIV